MPLVKSNITHKLIWIFFYWHFRWKCRLFFLQLYLISVTGNLTSFFFDLQEFQAHTWYTDKTLTCIRKIKVALFKKIQKKESFWVWSQNNTNKHVKIDRENVLTLYKKNTENWGNLRAWIMIFPVKNIPTGGSMPNAQPPNIHKQHYRNSTCYA